MKIFCRLLGHTWRPVADNPKTAWNVDKSGFLLVATPAATPRFYDECARCGMRVEVRSRGAKPGAA